MTLSKSLTLRHRIEYGALYVLHKVVTWLPYRCTHICAECLTFLSFTVFRLRRKETIKRIQDVLEIEYTQARAIARGAYNNLCAMGLEFIRFEKFHQVLEKGYIVIEGLEIVKDLQERGIGAVLTSMHCGSWEVSGASLSLMGYDMFYVVGIQHNAYIDRLINRMRETVGAELIPKKGALKEVFRRLKKGQFLGIIADQRVVGDSVSVEFFNRTVSAPRGPAAFARKCGVPVIPFVTFRGKKGKHIVKICEPIWPDTTISKAEDAQRMTQRYTTVFEEIIREHPKDWFWLHRRWKK